MSKDAKINKLSIEALQLAARYFTPPEPRVYEIWYNYASGENETLNRHINKLVARKTQLAPPIVDEIYQKFFDQSDKQLNATRMSLAVADNLTSTSATLETGVGEIESFGSKLQDTATALGQPDADVDALVDRLITDTNAQYEGIKALTSEVKSTLSELNDVREQLEELQTLANVDSLTQLNNRAYFDSRLELELEKASRFQGQLCVGLADIDNFKKLNDTYGHGFGDEVLKKFSEIIKIYTERGLIASRYGGEEFAFILPEASLRAAHLGLDRLRNSLSSLKFVDRNSGSKLDAITVSAGVTSFEPGDTPSAIMARADKLLYSAKAGGKNQVISGR